MHPPLQELEERCARIDRHWPRHPWDSQGRSRWAAWDTARYLQIVVLACLFSSLFLERGLWREGDKATPWPLLHLLTDNAGGLLVLALSILTGGWLVDRRLADQTAGESLVPTWLRGLRLLLMTVPIAGLSAIPLWRWIVQTHPAWAFRAARRPTLNLSGCSGPSFGPTRRFRSRCNSLRRRWGQTLPGIGVWLVAGEILPWLALLTWPLNVGALSPVQRGLLLQVGALCRIAAFFCGLLFGYLRAKQHRAAGLPAAALRLAPLAFLPPFPSFILGLLVWMATAGDDTNTLTERIHTNRCRPTLVSSLSHKVSSARSRTSATPRGGERSEAPSEENPRFLEASAAQEKRLAFLRLKILLTFFDAVALSLLSTWAMGRPVLRLDVSSCSLIVLLTVAAALGALVEVGFLLSRLLGWIKRTRGFYLPLGRSITYTSLTLTAGLLFGTFIAMGDTETAGALLFVVGLGSVLGAMVTFGPLHSGRLLPQRQVYLALAWILFFTMPLLVGSVLRFQPYLASPFISLFRILCGLVPILNLTLFLALRRWLLHPFSLGHLRTEQLPAGARFALAAVALTAALPLGAIAIPFWIYAHHRIFPKYERHLWKLTAT